MPSLYRNRASPAQKSLGAVFSSSADCPYAGQRVAFLGRVGVVCCSAQRYNYYKEVLLNPTDPTEPTEPTDPTEPTEPTARVFNDSVVHLANPDNPRVTLCNIRVLATFWPREGGVKPAQPQADCPACQQVQPQQPQRPEQPKPQYEAVKNTSNTRWHWVDDATDPTQSLCRLDRVDNELYSVYVELQNSAYECKTCKYRKVLP